MEVFQDTVQKIIRVDESLDIICLSFGFSPCGHTRSWIPRFYKTGEGCNCKRETYLLVESGSHQSKSPYSASGPFKPVVNVNNHRLAAKGVLVDCIE
jgi:hypothetical protein